MWFSLQDMGNGHGEEDSAGGSSDEEAGGYQVRF